MGLYRIGTKVELINGLTGVVVGYGHLDRGAAPSNTIDDVTPIYLVDLDEGFWDPKLQVYVSVLVVHGDSLTNNVLEV